MARGWQDRGTGTTARYPDVPERVRGLEIELCARSPGTHFDTGRTKRPDPGTERHVAAR
ncbi:protein of unknown function [Streptantibioticus cattleyicolor NRRL 8057 = DSM 46488]|nr:protein of unknown function [Streptantibioticus cattleyicolor NRRL 8057 = DSM 46488]